MLLAIDTSTALASVALYDGGVVAETNWLAGRRHSSEVLPTIDAMLARQGVRPADLQAVAVACGPGSYTGVRVGLALAKGLAFALALPLVDICSLDVLAAAGAPRAEPLRPLLDVGRGRFATAEYRWQGGQVVRQDEIQGVMLGEVAALVHRPTVISGDLDERARAALRATLGEWAILASPAQSVRRAGVLAELGWRRFLAGEVRSAHEVEPLYLGGQV